MNKIHNFQSELLKKIQLTETIFHLEYKVPETFVYTPGQFVGARVIKTHTRAYSIADVTKNVMTLLVDIKPDGIASKYFKDVQVGDITNILGPYGIYKVKDTSLTKVFVSTGTGIAPFISMIRDLVKNRPDVTIYNFFGSQILKHEVSYSFFENLLGVNFHYINCITREDVSVLKNKNPFHAFKSGRVTQVIQEYNFDWANTEFYICGGPEMVTDMANILKQKGADKIYIEKY